MRDIASAAVAAVSAATCCVAVVSPLSSSRLAAMIPSSSASVTPFRVGLALAAVFGIGAAAGVVVVSTTSHTSSSRRSNRLVRSRRRRRLQKSHLSDDPQTSHTTTTSQAPLLRCEAETQTHFPESDAVTTTSDPAASNASIDTTTSSYSSATHLQPIYTHPSRKDASKLLPLRTSSTSAESSTCSSLVGSDDDDTCLSSAPPTPTDLASPMPADLLNVDPTSISSLGSGGSIVPSVSAVSVGDSDSSNTSVTSMHDVSSLLIENARLRQHIGAARAVNKKLEAKVRQMARKQEALMESIKGLKKDVRSERDARFVVEQCLNERISQMELDLDFKETEILDLRDRERELTDEIEHQSFWGSSSVSGGSNASLNNLHNTPSGQPVSSSKSSPPCASNQTSSSAFNSALTPPPLLAGFNEDAEFKFPPRAIDEDDEEDDEEDVDDKQASASEEEGDDGEEDEGLTLSATPSKPIPAGRKTSESTDLTVNSNASTASTTTTSMATTLASPTNNNDSAVDMHQAQVIHYHANVTRAQQMIDHIQQELVSDVSASTLLVDIEEMTERLGSNDATSERGNEDLILDAIVEAFVRFFYAKVCVSGNGAKGSNDTASSALINRTLTKYVNIFAKTIDSSADEMRLLFALETSCSMQLPLQRQIKSLQSMAAPSVNPEAVPLLQRHPRLTIHAPMLMSLYKCELVEPDVVVSWYESGRPEAIAGGGDCSTATSAITPCSFIRDKCRVFINWLETQLASESEEENEILANDPVCVPDSEDIEDADEDSEVDVGSDEDEDHQDCDDNDDEENDDNDDDDDDDDVQVKQTDIKLSVVARKRREINFDRVIGENSDDYDGGEDDDDGRAKEPTKEQDDYDDEPTPTAAVPVAVKATTMASDAPTDSLNQQPQDTTTRPAAGARSSVSSATKPRSGFSSVRTSLCSDASTMREKRVTFGSAGVVGIGGF